MADINEAGLPVKSPGNTDDKVEVQLVDGVTPTQKQTVDTDGNAHVEVHGDDPGGSDRVLRTSELGAAAVDGVRDPANNTDPSNVGIIGHSRSATPTDVEQTLRLTGVQGTVDNTVYALDVAIHDAAGDKIDSSNPLPVTPTTPGTPLCDYDTASSIASGATSNHDLTIASGNTASISAVIGSASGRGKWELQVGDGAAVEVFTTCAVQFSTESMTNVFFDLSSAPIEVTGTATGTSVRLIRTNRDDDDAQDLYSTFIYNQV